MLLEQSITKKIFLQFYLLIMSTYSYMLLAMASIAGPFYKFIASFSLLNLYILALLNSFISATYLYTNCIILSKDFSKKIFFYYSS